MARSGNEALVMTAAMVTHLGSCAVFTGSIMTCIAYVALAIPRLVRVEVVERLISARGIGPT